MNILWIDLELNLPMFWISINLFDKAPGFSMVTTVFLYWPYMKSFRFFATNVAELVMVKQPMFFLSIGCIFLIS